MATKKPAGKKTAKPTRMVTAAAVRDERTPDLLRKAARALKKPGIDESVVFRGPNPSKVYAYAAYPGDPTRIVRTSIDGARVVGRLVNGKFRAAK